MARTPRFNPYERLIYRFYEAIYLLSLLGNTRGPHLASVFNPLSLIAVRRRFLKNLAFLCDGLKGGDSTASIAVQDHPDRFIFWVSSNKGPSDRALAFLRSVLEDVKAFVRSTQDDRRVFEDELTRKSVQSSVKRIRSQARSLFENVEFQEEGLHQICQDAYRVRNDPQMFVLEKLSQRFHNPTYPESVSVAFSRVRYIIGRLAAHMRSVKQLLDDGPHVDDTLEAYEVSAVSPPTVHAEVQMLHHFYDNGLAFAGADRYIATSKPACLCCRLYFRHHPAMCVERDSHQRVWPSWGPILFPLGQTEPDWAEQRDVLISVSHDIRKEVIMVIEQRQAISFAHPDSLTDITYTLDAADFESEDGQWDDDEEDLDSGSSGSGFDGGARL